MRNYHSHFKFTVKKYRILKSFFNCPSSASSYRSIYTFRWMLKNQSHKYLPKQTSLYPVSLFTAWKSNHSHNVKVGMTPKEGNDTEEIQMDVTLVKFMTKIVSDFFFRMDFPHLQFNTHTLSCKRWASPCANMLSL